MASGCCGPDTVSNAASNQTRFYSVIATAMIGRMMPRSTTPQPEPHMSDSYDDIPYQSIPFTDTQPENLAALARLFGLTTADPARARVLELGCASGGNLLPLAFYLPEGRYVGVELSARQVQDGRRLITELGLDNIRIEQADILTLDDTPDNTLGEFDYIIAHGVYSWVPPAVQARILDICARHLAPHGIAYISYNTWPGWHMRWTLRELLLRYTRDAVSPGERLARALRLLQEFPAALAHSDTLPAQYLQGEIARLREAHPSYLYHEYLESIDQPQYVSEFIAAAESHGLQYVCDADLKGMFPSVLGEAAEHWLEPVRGAGRTGTAAGLSGQPFVSPVAAMPCGCDARPRD